MSATEPRLPAWQQLLSRPRLVHRLASWGLFLAALVCGVGSFLRSGASASDGVRTTTLVLAIVAWIIVVLAACGEAFVAGISSAAQRSNGRPHYQIVVGIGIVIIAIFITALSSISAIEPEKLGLIGRIVKAAIAGMLPLIVGITLTAGFAVIWIYDLRPRIESRLEARLREYEQRQE